MKKISILLVLCISYLFAYSNYTGQDLCTYYGGANGKKQAALKTALHGIINPHNAVGYDGLYNVYADADKKPDGTIWDIYSEGCNFKPSGPRCGNYSGICDCFNREHTIPQSWFSQQSTMRCDAFHVLPTDGKVNGQRSNFPYGECAGGSSAGPKALGKLGNCTFPGYSGKVFEPDDQYKGDIARIYFYFVTCYEGFKYQNGALNALANNTYPGFTDWYLKLMLQWHRQDPVSQKEIDRNNAVASHQKNRNPFVDYPDLVEYIWGSKQNVAWSCPAAPAKPGEGGGAGGGVTPDPGIVITVSGQTIDIQGLQKTELIQVVDGTGNVVYQATTTCTNHMITVPHAGQYQVKINGAATGGTLDIK